MRGWTDIDYAQAAIDMLPDTVEEIEGFLTVNRVPNEWPRKRVASWVRKWTDTDVLVVGPGHVFLPEGYFPTPEHVEKYIFSYRL